MKFKEFKERIKEWGEKYNYNAVVYDYDDHIKITVEDKDFVHMICTVHKTERFVMDLIWMAYRLLRENEKHDLFKIVTEFSATKIEDREDVQIHSHRTPLFDIIRELEGGNIDASNIKVTSLYREGKKEGVRVEMWKKEVEDEQTATATTAEEIEDTRA